MMMKLLHTTLFLVYVLFASAADQPNIVLILTDDQDLALGKKTLPFLLSFIMEHYSVLFNYNFFIRRLGSNASNSEAP